MIPAAILYSSLLGSLGTRFERHPVSLSLSRPDVTSVSRLRGGADDLDLSSSSDNVLLYRFAPGSNATLEEMAREFKKETLDAIRPTFPDVRPDEEFDSQGRNIYDMNFVCNVREPGAEGTAASKWRFIVGGLSDQHLVAMHTDHKTLLSFYGLTPDALVRMMPKENAGSYFLFSDSSCILTDRHCPWQNCTLRSETEYIHNIGKIFVDALLQGKGFYMPDEGILLGPYWYWRNVGPYILITHEKTTMELWLTTEGFVHISENNTELSCIVRDGEFHPRDLGALFEDQVGCELSCLRETGLQLIPDRDEVLKIVVEDESGYEMQARKYRKEIRRKLFPKGSLLDTSESSTLQQLQMYLDQGESSKAVEVMEKWASKRSPAKPPPRIEWGAGGEDPSSASQFAVRQSESSHELGEGASDGVFFNRTNEEIMLDLRSIAKHKDDNEGL